VSQQIVALAVQAERLPRTLVHGDFDTGNVVMISEDRIAALDWGLAHCNVPLIDVAHMVGRFDAATSRSMAVRYFEALNLPVFPLGKFSLCQVNLNPYYYWIGFTTVSGGVS